MKPKALDLFCKAGGASMGLHLAGFDVTGVDIEPQPRYPFRFIQADALGFPLEGYDFIWASPPCQRYSIASQCRPGLAGEYPDLIAPIRDRLERAGVPYVIENVAGAFRLLRKPLLLCGTMFGLDLYRHRFFEANYDLGYILHPNHLTICSRAGHWKPGTWVSVTGNCAPIELSKKAMQIDWMNRAELAEAIPPAYSEYIGKIALEHIQSYREAIGG